MVGGCIGIRPVETGVTGFCLVSSLNVVSVVEWDHFSRGKFLVRNFFL